MDWSLGCAGLEITDEIRVTIAGLRCDRHSNLVGYLQARTPLEPFLVEENLHQALELGLVVRRELGHVRHVSSHDRDRISRQRRSHQLAAALLLQPEHPRA